MKVRGILTSVSRELAEMQAQIRLEKQRKTKSNFRRLFNRQYIRRTLLGTLIVNMCKLSGSNIIQNYQDLMYSNLGYEGKEALLITAIYGFMALVGQLFSIFTVADHWPRRRTVITGWLTLAGCLTVLAVLSALCGETGTPNVAGQRAGVDVDKQSQRTIIETDRPPDGEPEDENRRSGPGIPRTHRSADGRQEGRKDA